MKRLIYHTLPLGLLLLVATLVTASCSKDDPEPVPTPIIEPEPLPNIQQMLAEGYWTTTDEAVFGTDSLYNFSALYIGAYPGGRHLIGHDLANNMISPFKLEAEGLATKYSEILYGAKSITEYYEKGIRLEVTQTEEGGTIYIESSDPKLNALWFDKVTFTVLSAKEGKIELYAEMTDEKRQTLLAAESFCEETLGPVIDRITGFYSVWTRLDETDTKDAESIETLDNAVPSWAWHWDDQSEEFVVDPF